MPKLQRGRIRHAARALDPTREPNNGLRSHSLDQTSLQPKLNKRQELVQAQRLKFRSQTIPRSTEQF